VTTPDGRYPGPYGSPTRHDHDADDPGREVGPELTDGRGRHAVEPAQPVGRDRPPQPSPWQRQQADGIRPAAGQGQWRPSAGPGYSGPPREPLADPEPPTGLIPTTEPPTGLIPTAEPPTGLIPTTEPPTGLIPTAEPPTGLIPTSEPRTGLIPTSGYAQPPDPGHDDATVALPTVSPQSRNDEPPVESGESSDRPRFRIPKLRLSPAAMLASYRNARPPKSVHWAFLAAIGVVVVNIVAIVVGMALVAAVIGSYAVSFGLTGYIVDLVLWAVLGGIAVLIAVTMRAGRQWARFTMVALAVVAAVMATIALVQSLTWITYTGALGFFAVLFALAALVLSVAGVVLMFKRGTGGYFRW